MLKNPVLLHDIPIESSNQIEYIPTISKWYDRGGFDGVDYAIDGTGAAPHVIQASSNVLANLPADKRENVYAYARATFDYLADRSSPGYIPYGDGLVNPP